MPSKKRLTRLEERLQKEAQKLKSQLEKELAPKREPLHLQCTDEELSAAQIAYQNRIQKEIKEAQAKIDAAMKNGPSEVLFKGDYVQAYHIGGTTLVGTSQSGGGSSSRSQSPVTTSSKSSKKTRSSSVQSRSGLKHTPQVIHAPAASPQIPANIRPTEGTAVGGLATGKPPPIVDLTMDDGRPAPDSREVSFNKLQGKTFPSLVVVARPHLRAKDTAAINDRPALDAKVKSVLMHTPTKFTEWLIQQGLVRSEQTCIVHPNTKLKLGMYSDVSKFPYSGGYVWISECCPQRFVSVFSGSLFEAASHPPSVLLKLIYHWACQTNVQNIVQWVKVDNLYVKGLFTWLRAACTTALHQHYRLMGGRNKRIEVGVISLGTTSQDGHQRQVKVEVLGILDPEAKQIRLRAVEPLADGDSRNYKRRFSKILEPLNSWVHKESIIMTDLTVDKSCLNTLGFEYVVQSSASDSTSGNQTVMEYLRRIVPRMFQNTLSLLSRQIIQQFLDELVWREWFGPTAAQAFDNIVQHLAEQTRQNCNDTLIVRLNKIAANPFKNWSFYNVNNAAEKSGDEQIVRSPSPTPPSTPTPNSLSNNTISKRRKRFASSANSPVPNEPPAKSKKQAMSTAASAVPVIDLDADEPAAISDPASLESYYYGTLEGKESNMQLKVKLNIKCCSCKMTFTNNLALLDHLLAHAHNIPSGTYAAQCRFCLAMLPSKDALCNHINESHPCGTYQQNSLICVICETRFTTVGQLTKHMSNVHVAAELPYECGTCYHRTSSHRAAIDHFYQEHDGTAMLQCPFCLKSISVWNVGRAFNQNVTFFLAHLQKHQKKGTAKKCNRCALWFVHKGTLKEHQQRSHNSLVGKRNLHMWQPSSAASSGVALARTNYTNEPAEDETRVADEMFDNMTVIVPDGLKCKECDMDVGDDDHYTGVLNCPKCSYLTCCSNAMQDHSLSCKDSAFGVVTPAPLISDMFCVCGYSSNDGNILAKHLALCERKSAYPSMESAKEAIAQHSMLDVLGLVRRPEEPTTAPDITQPPPLPPLPDTDIDTDKPEDVGKKFHSENEESSSVPPPPQEMSVKEENDIFIESEVVQDDSVDITETEINPKIETQSPASQEDVVNTCSSVTGELEDAIAEEEAEEDAVVDKSVTKMEEEQEAVAVATPDTSVPTAASPSLSPPPPSSSSTTAAAETSTETAGVVETAPPVESMDIDS